MNDNWGFLFRDCCPFWDVTVSYDSLYFCDEERGGENELESREVVGHPVQKRNPSIRWWFPSAPVKTHNVLFSYIPFPFLPLPCFISIWVLASHFSFLSGRGWLLITWRAAIFLLKLQSINGGEKWIEGYDFLVEWYRLCCGDENIFVGSGNECFKERNIIVRKMTMWKHWVESYTKEHEGNRRPPFCQHHHQQATLCFSIGESPWKEAMPAVVLLVDKNWDDEI